MRYERIGDLMLLALDMQAVRGGLSVDDIAERYGVARRTAFRMKEAVMRCFPQTEEVPTGDKTKRWRIPRGTLDKLVAFSAEELAALGTAVRMMERNGMHAEAAEIDLVVAKLGALARPEVARRVEPDLEALLEAEGIAMRPGPKLKVSAEVVDGLRNAIKACRKVRISYRAKSEKVARNRTIHPYGFLHGHRNYLVGFHEGRGKVAIFSLPQVKVVEVLEGSFEREHGFDLEEFATRAFGVYQGDHQYDVVWRFRPEVADVATEFQFHPNQTVERQADGSLVVRFRASGLIEMAWHLYCWGDGVDVLEPRELAEIVHPHRHAWDALP